MALDLATVIFDIILLLRIALFIGIPVFIIALICIPLKERLVKRFKLSWIQGTAITTYLAVTVILIFLYLLPWYFAYSESLVAGQTAPGILALTPGDLIIAGLLTILKIIMTALIFTVLLLPLEFFATFLLEKLEEKKFPKPAKIFAAVYCTCLLAAIIVLFAFPWIINGLVYLVYWG